MISAKLSSKFQLAIPKAIRDELDLKAGQQFTLITKGNMIELVPVRSLKNHPVPTPAFHLLAHGSPGAIADTQAHARLRWSAFHRPACEIAA